MLAVSVRRLVFTLVFALSAIFLHPAWSQSNRVWPAQPIRAVVPYPAGGVVDLQARAVLQVAARSLGQPLIVENRPGANANIGAEFVARAVSDGYTLLVSAPFIVNNPILEKGLRWSSSQLAPVVRMAVSPGFMVVSKGSPIRDFPDFLRRARAAQPPLRYGDAGAGNTGTVSLNLMAQEAGFRFESILYKGLPPVIPDLVNGSLDFSFLPLSLARSQLESGKVRVLVNIGARRSPALPDVPTIGESGLPGATVLSWYGLHVPAGTPDAVIGLLESAVRAALATDEVRARLAAGGGEEAFLGHADFVKFLLADRERTQRLIRPAGT